MQGPGSAKQPGRHVAARAAASAIGKQGAAVAAGPDLKRTGHVGGNGLRAQRVGSTVVDVLESAQGAGFGVVQPARRRRGQREDQTVSQCERAAAWATVSGAAHAAAPSLAPD